jgi:hypothetical protein
LFADHEVGVILGSGGEKQQLNAGLRVGQALVFRREHLERAGNSGDCGGAGQQKQKADCCAETSREPT